MLFKFPFLNTSTNAYSDVNSGATRWIFILFCSVCVERTHWVSNILSRKQIVFLFKAGSYRIVFFLYVIESCCHNEDYFLRVMVWLNCNVLPIGRKKERLIFFFYFHILSVLPCNRMWYQKTCKISTPSEAFVVCCKAFGYLTRCFTLVITAD